MPKREVGAGPVRDAEAVALNPETPDSVLAVLVQEGDEEVAGWVAARFPCDTSEPRIRVEVNRHNGYMLETHEFSMSLTASTALPQVLAVAFEDSPYPFLHERLAADPALGDDASIRLAEHPDAFVRTRLAANPRTPVTSLAVLVERGESVVMQALAQRGDLDSLDSVIEGIAKSRCVIAQRLMLARDGYRDRLLAWPDPKVRALVARFVEPGEDAVWSTLFHDPDKSVREAAAKHAVGEALDVHAGHECSAVRRLVATRTESGDVLIALSEDSDPVVRRRVARNERAGSDLLALLIEDGDVLTARFAADRFLAILGA